MPTIITREEWGARYQDGYDTAAVPARHVILHHSATAMLPTAASRDAEDAQMRILELIGQQRFGSGMSYTFVAFPSGRIYQGVSINRASAHTLNHNFDARAIVMAGNYQDNEPSPMMLRSIHELVVTGHDRGWWLLDRVDGGHRDFERPGYTECPGDAGERAIARINSWTEPLPPTEETEMPLLPLFIYADGTPLYMYYPANGDLVGIGNPLERDVLTKLHTQDQGAPLTIHLSTAELNALTDFHDRKTRTK